MVLIPMFAAKSLTDNIDNFAFSHFFIKLLIKNRIKMRPIVPAVAIAAFFMVACQPTATRNNEKQGGTLRINISDIPHLVFPGQVEKRSEQILVYQVYSGLVKYNPKTLEIIPSIAKKHSISTDGLTYTFVLDNRAKFQNDRCFPQGKGRHITAADFKYSIEQICRNKLTLGHGISRQLKNIEGADDFLPTAKNNDNLSISGIVAENDSVLVIKLKKADDLFLHFLASTNALVFAKEVFNAYGVNGTVGSGPFKMKYPKIIGQQIVLTRDPDYWGLSDQKEQLPYLDSIVCSFITSPKKEIYMFGIGEVNVVFDMQQNQLTPFLESNIDGFKSDPPLYILSNTSNSNNDKRFNLITSDVNGLYFNSQNYFDFTEVYLQNPMPRASDTNNK